MLTAPWKRKAEMRKKNPYCLNEAIMEWWSATRQTSSHMAWREPSEKE